MRLQPHVQSHALGSLGMRQGIYIMITTTTTQHSWPRPLPSREATKALTTPASSFCSATMKVLPSLYIENSVSTPIKMK